jgi:hypothetical protein
MDSVNKKILGLCALFFLLPGCSACNRSNTQNVSLPDTKIVMESYNPQFSRTMQYLDMLVMKGSSSIEEVKPYLSNKDPKQRWVAVYIIGRVANHDQVNILLPLLQDSEEAVRISAAGTLANKGYREALPVLISGTRSTGTISYLHPEQEIAGFCFDVLSVYTKQTFFTPEEWEQWWKIVEGKLSWDEATKTYH